MIRLESSQRVAKAIVGWGFERLGIAGLAEKVRPGITAPKPATQAIADATRGVKQLDLSTEAVTANREAFDGTVMLMTLDVTGGHQALAKSVGKEVESLYPKARVIHANPLDAKESVFGSKLRNAMAKIHTWERAKRPFVYEARYTVRSTDSGTRSGRRVYDALFRSAISSKIAAEKPDVIVSTHPAVTATLGHMRQDGTLGIPAVAALNDSAPNGLWLAPGMDLHVALNPNDLARLDDTAALRSGEKINRMVARPPIAYAPVSNADRSSARALLGLPEDKNIVLVTSGSMGVPLPDEVYDAMLLDKDAMIVVATGKNEAMRAHLSKRYEGKNLMPIGFTDKMYQYVAASDAVFVRAHGMMLLEAAAAGKPIVVFKPEGGHARRSIQALHDDGLIFKADSLSDLANALSGIRNPSGVLNTRQHHLAGLFVQPHAYADAIVGAAVAQ